MKKELKLSLLKFFKRNTITRRKDALKIWETRISNENRIQCKIIKLCNRQYIKKMREGIWKWYVITDNANII